MKRRAHLALRIVASLVLVVVIADVGDFVWLRLRLAHPRWGTALGTVTVNPTYAVPLKSGRVQYYEGQPYAQPCTLSLLPHMGYSPCWYLDRKNQKIVPMMLTAAAARGAPTDGDATLYRAEDRPAQ